MTAGPKGPAGPIPAVLAVVPRDGRFMLVRRANAPDAGLWGFPGGKIERGETMLRAAEREAREETGVECRGLEAIDVLDAIGPDDHHFILIAVLCRWAANEPAAADDAIEAGWFDLPSIDALGTAVSKDVLSVATAASSLAAVQSMIVR